MKIKDLFQNPDLSIDFGISAAVLAGSARTLYF